MGKYGMTDYYKNMLEKGLEYQDFIADQLRKADPCIIIGAYSSRKYQNERGESMSGVEIKLDEKMKETGNLYIEVAEKSNAKLPNYVPSGIMRDDNTWLFLIGDYEQAFLFSKQQLRMVYAEENRYKARGIIVKTNPTSIGFLYPIKSAMNCMCLKRFIFTKQGG